MPKMMIDVTDEDITLGVRDSGIFCPIARAIKRATKAQYCVGVIDVVAPDGHCCRLPRAATEFIRMFDAGSRCFPFTFEIVLGGLDA